MQAKSVVDRSGTTWLAILSYAAVEFVTHLCNIYVQEYNEQIPSIFGGGGGNGELINKNNISKGSFESFIGSARLALAFAKRGRARLVFFRRNRSERNRHNARERRNIPRRAL